MNGLLKFEVHSFLLAVQFLTRIPIPRSIEYAEPYISASMRHYPLVGVIVGVCAAASYIIASAIWPPLIAVILSTVASILITGAFHEDGLADMLDGVGGGTTRERALSIMKDSRIGTYGAVGLVTVLAIKFASLSLLSNQSTVVYVLVVAHALSRLSSVVVIATSQYVRPQGKSEQVTAGMSSSGLIYPLTLAGLCCVGLNFLISPIVMIAAIAGLVLGHISARLIYERKLGGYTGDCLGGTQQLSELGIYLGVLACL